MSDLTLDRLDAGAAAARVAQAHDLGGARVEPVEREVGHVA